MQLSTCCEGWEGSFAPGTWRYKDGLTINLSSIRHGRSSAVAAPENTPCVSMRGTVDNGSRKTLDLTLLSQESVYGTTAHTADEIYDTGTDAPNIHLLPGHSANWKMEYAVPANVNVMQIEVTPDFDRDVAVIVASNIP